MSTDKQSTSLRVKVQLGNDTAIVQLTNPVALENSLQMLGDWVLAALEQRADGAAEAARRHSDRAPGTGLGG